MRKMSHFCKNNDKMRLKRPKGRSLFGFGPFWSHLFNIFAMFAMFCDFSAFFADFAFLRNRARADGIARAPGYENQNPCKGASRTCPLRQLRANALRELWRARSLLYRRRFLRPNTHFSAFFEIYKIQNPLHRSKPKISQKFTKTFSFLSIF